MILSTTWKERGHAAPDFDLPGTDGLAHTLASVGGQHGTVVAFICNHCPYVKAVAERMVRDAEALAAAGVGFVAISANDVTSHPADSFDNMKLFAETYGFSFPYLYDESQTTARAYDAACTPEFFGIDRNGALVYRGRLDEGRRDPPPAGARRELVEAMMAVATTGNAPEEQIASVGCSIKWKS
ncbi:MAG: thioredoxin family protein [Alphaproteobacteria bacterium]